MKKLLLFITFIYFTFNVFSQFPSPKSPPRFYNSYSTLKLLSAAQEQELEEKLQKFEKETSNEITIIVIDDLLGMEPWDYAAKIGEKWGVGKEKEDNGIILLIKPTQTKGKREVFISVGRGLTGAIPSYTTNEIVENELLPNFKKENYFQGINNAVTVLSDLSKGKYNSKKYSEKNKDEIGFFGGLFMVLFIIFIVIIVMKNGGKGGRGGNSGLGSSIASGIFWGSIGRGGFGGGSGGFGGGSSGGGFGGFGGGSFGGSGSGGSW